MESEIMEWINDLEGVDKKTNDAVVKRVKSPAVL